MTTVDRQKSDVAGRIRSAFFLVGAGLGIGRLGALGQFHPEDVVADQRADHLAALTATMGFRNETYPHAGNQRGVHLLGRRHPVAGGVGGVVERAQPVELHRAALRHVVRQHARQARHGDELCQRHQQQQDEQQHHGVHDACHGRASAVVDVGHGPGNGSRGGDAAEQRGQQVGGALGDKFGVRVVVVARHAVGHGGREQRLDGAQHGNGQRHGEEVLHRLPVQCGQGGVGQGGADAEAVADGVDALYAGIRLEQPHRQRHHHDGHQRAGNLLEHAGREGDNQDACHAYCRVPPVDAVEVAGVDHPLAHEVARHLLAPEVKPQDVRHLRGEDGDRYAAGEAHHDGVGNELDDRPQPEHSQQHEDDARHERGRQQSGLAVLLDDAVHDDDERPRGPAYLHPAAAEQRDDEARDDGGNDALLGRYP